MDLSIKPSITSGINKLTLTEVNKQDTQYGPQVSLAFTASSGKGRFLYNIPGTGATEQALTLACKDLMRSFGVNEANEFKPSETTPALFEGEEARAQVNEWFTQFAQALCMSKIGETFNVVLHYENRKGDWWLTIPKPIVNTVFENGADRRKSPISRVGQPSVSPNLIMVKPEAETETSEVDPFAF